MRCIVEPTWGHVQCNRCQIADVPCHYSVPRKPGRPPAKAAGALVAGLAASSETTLPTKYTNVVEDTRVEDRLNEDESFSRTESFAELGPDAASWPSLGFPDEFLDKPGAQPSSEAGYQQDTWAPEYHYGKFATIQPSQLLATPVNPSQPSRRRAQTDESRAASPLQPGLTSMSSGPNTPTGSESGQQCAQRLSDFNARLARPVDLGPDVSPTQVEQAAAHVLESSAVFLDLVKFLRAPDSQDTESREVAPRHRRQKSTQTAAPANLHTNDGDDDDDGGGYNGEDKDSAAVAQARIFVPDTATVLQLVVFSMRLTELHYDLYSAVHTYLQRHDRLLHAHGNTTAAAAAIEPPLQLPLSLSIAGVALTPHPRFQLQLLLQTGVHYLGSSEQLPC